MLRKYQKVEETKLVPKESSEALRKTGNRSLDELDEQQSKPVAQPPADSQR
jgi:hypothetical protein